MSTLTTDRIEKRIRLRHPRSRVWKALTDSQEFGKWFGAVFTEPFRPCARLRGKATHPGYEHLTMDVTIERMDDWFSGTPRAITHEIGLGPRHTLQWMPRDLGPLVDTLDELGIDHVYAEYWLAYRLAFDTRERIVAVENPFDDVTVVDGLAVPGEAEVVRYEQYDHAVRRARAGYVFYEQILDTIPIVPELERAGYTRHDVGSYVVFAPPAR